MVGEVEITCPVASSDHNLVSFHLFGSFVHSDAINTNFNYNKANFDDIQKSIMQVNWDIEFENKNMTEMWNIFHNILILNRDRYVPKYKINKRQYPKWMTKKIKRLI